jgi:DNA polymerase III epsilon subunit-like protein
MILVYDVETTGLPDFKARSNDPNQPHLVQIALIRHADDGTEARAKTMIIKPNGWTISPEVTAIHGISHERAMDEGVPENEAVAAYIMSQGVCSLRVAHNTPFDDRIMRIAMTRYGIERDFIEAIEKRASFDTCAAAKPILKLPPTERQIAAGFTGPKSPNLGEAIKHFFGEELPGAHDALVDARACARIYFKIRGGV